MELNGRAAVKKTGIFKVRLTVRVDPPPPSPLPYGQGVEIFSKKVYIFYHLITSLTVKRPFFTTPLISLMKDVLRIGEHILRQIIFFLLMLSLRKMETPPPFMKFLFNFFSEKKIFERVFKDLK